MRIGRALVWTALSAILLASCTKPPGGECDPDETASGCPSGYYCAKIGICTATCSTDSDCVVPCKTASDCGMFCVTSDCDAVCTPAGACSNSPPCHDGHCISCGGESCKRDPYGPRTGDTP